jgi:predicted transport protein
MPLFKISNAKLVPLETKHFDLEREIQSLTEKNLSPVFGLTFVSGSLNKEFSVGVDEQTFYIDTLALDETDNSLVLIEYKRERNFSVIDQGFAYLSAMLNHKADFVLELNERLHKSFTKDDISWEASRILFISPEFTNYQKNAINFKDLPIFLYEVVRYSNDLINFNPIKAMRASESITKLSKDRTIRSVAREIKVFTVDELIKPNWSDTSLLLNEFEKQLIESIPKTRIKINQNYIAYISDSKKSYVEVVPQQSGLKVYFRFPAKSSNSPLKIEDCSKVGRWANGISLTHISSLNEVPEVIRLANESLKFLKGESTAQ